MSATAEEKERLCFEFLLHVLITCGRFGCEVKREWLRTIGRNKKGTMDNEKSKRCVNNSTVPLFPNLKGTSGKSFLLQVDSSPSCNGQDLLNKC